MVHLLMVLVSGVRNNLRSMITAGTTSERNMLISSNLAGAAFSLALPPASAP